MKEKTNKHYGGVHNITNSQRSSKTSGVAYGGSNPPADKTHLEKLKEKGYYYMMEPILEAILKDGKKMMYTSEQLNDPLFIRERRWYNYALLDFMAIIRKGLK